MAEVIQADRDAAVLSYSNLLDPPSRIYLAGIRDGIRDNDPLVLAFASYRERAEAAVVAWLLTQKQSGDGAGGEWDSAWKAAIEHAADAIARQAHRSAP